MTGKRYLVFVLTFLFVTAFFYTAYAWTPKPVASDPLVRMPGSQPEQGVVLEAPRRCMNCHEGYSQPVEPGFNWKGSMMAQSARDPIFWACLTVAAQDSIYATGNPNAADICLRCHFPEGWLGGRSDPVNASRMTGSDFDGIHCDFCHTMYDPFYEETYAGTRESSDWKGYWDEATSLSAGEATKTYEEDKKQSALIKLFSGQPFYRNNVPVYNTYRENTSGQYFVSSGSEKRAGFADATARHRMFYSRYHKSKYFCATCHDVSNPVLANLGRSGLTDQSEGKDLITEQYSAARYFHVERTFSEFMLSAYGRTGAATNPEFRAQGAPDIAYVNKCQDCHMRDVAGAGTNKRDAVYRPDGSKEHPNSGQPLHDLTGGNTWISLILASLDPNGPVYDARNVQILDKGPGVLTLDLNAGESPKVNGAALKAGSDRALQQLALAGTILDLNYNPDTGATSFKVQNNTGHKLISGFPEGRRMFVNIKGYTNGQLAFEVNPYDYTFGTLKGLPTAPAGYPSLGPNEYYNDHLVYEVQVSSSITGEDKTFHFVLADKRYKDNRIPPKGFALADSYERLSEPVWNGASAPTYFSAAEYAGGYDQVSLNLPAAADSLVVTLYYQGTSREYIEFLRDQINGSGTTLPASAYIAQTDPFFSRLKAWGDTIYELWEYNHGKNLPGLVPAEMTSASWRSMAAPPPQACETPSAPSNLTATGGRRSITLSWQATGTVTGGYHIYYDQNGKRQYVGSVGPGTTTFTDTGLRKGATYTYVVTAYNTCNDGTTRESGPSDTATATAQ
jgi:hypothetical protein